MIDAEPIAIRSLHTYPVKSAAGRSHESWPIDAMGLAEDRRWMLVDEDGTFLSQRELPQLATLRTEIEGDVLRLSASGLEPLAVVTGSGQRRPVTVWRDTVEAATSPADVDAALSRWIGQSVALVHFDETARRSVSRDWVEGDAQVGFADGFPVLVVTVATLEAVNAAIEQAGGAALPMDRYRPNIVIDGSEPFAEHGWASIEIGGVTLDLVKPCARCVITTTDQESGERRGKEPLATLARMQRSRDKRAAGAIFGWNAVPRGNGTLRVGDAVKVTQRREPAWPIF